MENLEGNLTTIVKFGVMAIAPYVGVAEATSNQLVAVIVAIIGLALAYLDAKHNNTIFKQPPTQISGEEDGKEPESC